MTIDLHAVLDELSQRRRARGGPNVATMTVAVFFDDASIGEWARDRVHALAAKHPSRVIVFDDTQSNGEQHVDTNCSTHEDCVKTRGDWIELHVKDSGPEALHAANSALCLPDAPCVLIWVAANIGSDPRFWALAQHMRTVVYNSSLLDVDDRALQELVDFSVKHPGVVVSDLAYLRLAPWQESIALFFDAKHVLDELFDLRRVEVTCGSDPEAYYLLGWLASRLEWAPCAPNAFCNRFGTQIEFAIVREGLPRRIRRVALTSSQAQFVAEIADESAEAIVLTVSGAKTHPQRCRPINNIDIATLVERAILYGRNDRVYQETLIAAGEILACRKGAAR